MVLLYDRNIYQQLSLDIEQPRSNRRDSVLTSWFMGGANRLIRRRSEQCLNHKPVDITNDAAMFLLINQRAQILRDAIPLAYERAVSAQQRQAVRF
jgi:hypothetical protein